MGPAQSEQGSKDGHMANGPLWPTASWLIEEAKRAKFGALSAAVPNRAGYNEPACQTQVTTVSIRGRKLRRI
jgi:hypothetical protein